ncbi:MAG: PP2C family protein-serine/threonine phosphatase [Ilumatobacter sp.]|uniref:PP2C family protein-serine/threonine phosphatase n=1 Tax=Ilumatobacter sp. TaxID=1967498 RepID=UPI003C739C84
MERRTAEGPDSRGGRAADVSGDVPAPLDTDEDEPDELSARLATALDDERLLRNELRSTRNELRGVQAEIVRERLGRMLRSEVSNLAASTSGEASRSGVAAVIAEGATKIFSATWAMVAFVTDEQFVRIVHGGSVPDEITRDWAEVPLDTSVPICDVLRGAADRIELGDVDEFAPWPLLVAEADRAMVASMVAEPIGTVGDPDAVLAIGWSDPHDIDDLERELLELLVGRVGPAFTRSVRSEIDAEIASTLQTWLLDVGTADVEGLEVAKLYEPGRDLLSVGGDWHDIVPLSGSRFAIVIGDVCGHDVRAAVEMSQVRHVLATNLHVLDDPVAALQMSDEYLRRRTPHPLATALVVVVEPDGSATLTSAGHPPPIACRPGDEAYVVECGLGPPLGSGLGGYSSRTTRLTAGTVLTCYTDGVVETRSDDIDACIEDLRRNIEIAMSGADEDGTNALPAVLDMLQRRVDTPWRTDDAAAIITTFENPSSCRGGSLPKDTQV